MEDRIITTTNGFVVTIKPYLTSAQYNAYQKVLMDGVRIDPETQQQTEKGIPLSNAYSANQTVARLIVKSIADKDGVAFSGTIDDLKAEDGEDVLSVVSELTQEASAAVQKKKVTTP